MKKFFLVTIVLLSSLAAMAQSVSDTTKYYYCELRSVRKPMSPKYIAEIDFGNNPKFMSDTTYARVINKKENLPYGFQLEMLNFMGAKGWRVVLYHGAGLNGIELETYLLEKRR